jgi:hypothetical protein
MLQRFKNNTSRPLVHTCCKVNALTISNMFSDVDNQAENLKIWSLSQASQESEGVRTLTLESRS